MQVSWSIAALNHLDDIHDFIALDSPTAAYKLTSSLLQRTNELLASKSYGRRKGRLRGTRELAISRTPYIAVYRVQDDVEIIAVVHGARDWPGSFS